MLVCQVAKEKYLCDRIIARVNNPRNHDHFRLLGIQPAVSATDLILRLIEHEVPRYGLVHLLALEEERLEIIELEVIRGRADRRRGASSDIEPARGQPDHLGAARRLGLRAQGRHGDRGRRRSAARARPGPGGGDHRLLRAERAVGRAPELASRAVLTTERWALPRADYPGCGWLSLGIPVRDGVIGNTRASGARIWGSSPCPGVARRPWDRSLRPPRL